MFLLALLMKALVGGEERKERTVNKCMARKIKRVCGYIAVNLMLSSSAMNIKENSLCVMTCKRCGISCVQILTLSRCNDRAPCATESGVAL